MHQITSWTLAQRVMDLRNGGPTPSSRTSATDLVPRVLISTKIVTFPFLSSQVCLGGRPWLFLSQRREEGKVELPWVGDSFRGETVEGEGKEKQTEAH